MTEVIVLKKKMDTEEKIDLLLEAYKTIASDATLLDMARKTYWSFLINTWSQFNILDPINQTKSLSLELESLIDKEYSYLIKNWETDEVEQEGGWIVHVFNKINKDDSEN